MNRDLGFRRGMNWSHRSPLVLAVLLLGACAGRAPREALPPLATAPAVHQAQREAALAMRPDWSLQGRVALSNGRDGGSGRIDWQQQGGHYSVALSAPITRQSWRLSGDALAAPAACRPPRRCCPAREAAWSVLYVARSASVPRSRKERITFSPTPTTTATASTITAIAAAVKSGESGIEPA